MIRKVILSLTCLTTICVLPLVAGTKKKVHTIGDSTMATYATDGDTDKCSWAQMLKQYFNANDVTFVTHGRAGASSRSYYDGTGCWPALIKGGKDEMQAGDFLLIQFGHNDEKCNGADGEEVKRNFRNRGAVARASEVDTRGTTPFDTYKEYLRNYIKEAKAMGVKPIVVSSICRKSFTIDGKKLVRLAKHDLGDKFSVIKNGLLLENQKNSVTDHTYDYSAAAKAVANEFDDVPFIDMTDITARLFEKYGEANCSKYIFYKGDKAHLNTFGATLVAREFAVQVKNQVASELSEKKRAVLADLANEAIVTDGITFYPNNGDMWYAYSGTEVNRTFEISAVDLPTEAGKFNISTLNGFQVSTDKEHWSNSVDVDYSGSTLLSTVFVRIDSTMLGPLNGKLVVSNGTVAKSLDLKIFYAKKHEGEETECIWPLNSTSLAATSPVLTASDASLVGMVSTRSTQTPIGHTKMLMFTNEGEVWPEREINTVDTRYVQFTAKNNTDKMFNLEDVTLDVCGWGGNSNCYQVYYATTEDFSDKTLIGGGLPTANKTAVTLSKTFISKVGPGKSFYIRVYPWQNSNTSSKGKSIGISNVTVRGIMSVPPAPASAAKKTSVKKTTGGKRKK